MSKGPVHKIECDGQKHRLVLTDTGIEFLDHGPEIWQQQRTQDLLCALSGEDPPKPSGCYHVAAIILSRRYLDLSAPSAARVLLATLWGRQLGRRANRP